VSAEITLHAAAEAILVEPELVNFHMSVKKIRLI
jgi:hypothetical protein